MTKYKCQASNGNSCLTCRHKFEPLTAPPCLNCQHGRNCPLGLSDEYSIQRKICEGCNWEKGAWDAWENGSAKSDIETTV